MQVAAGYLHTQVMCATRRRGVADVISQHVNNSVEISVSRLLGEAVNGHNKMRKLEYRSALSSLPMGGLRKHR